MNDLLDEALALVHQVPSGFHGRVVELRVEQRGLDLSRERVALASQGLDLRQRVLVRAVVRRRAALQRGCLGDDRVGTELADARVELLVTDGEVAELSLLGLARGDERSSVRTRPSSM